MKRNREFQYLKTITLLITVFLSLPSYGDRHLAVKANFGNEFELKKGEHILHEEPGYVEIALDDNGEITEEDDDSEHSVDSENGSHRRLYYSLKNPKSKSNLCKTECIDKGNVFCPSDNYEGGLCCSTIENCPPGRSTDRNFYQTSVWCSNHNPHGTPDVFKWFVCPNEASCGDNGKKYIIRPLDGEVITRAIDKDNNLFLDNDICAWVIKNPDNMGARDWMWIEITKVDRCGVFVSKAYNYKYKSRNKPKKVNNVKLGMLRGLDYYIISHAVSQFPAYFKLKTWIERHTPPSEPKPKVDP